jgi:putative membrane protein
MLGSLNKVWPWQQVLETRIDSEGLEQVLFSKSVGPITFGALRDNFFYGNDAQFLAVTIAMLIGFALIFVVERAGNQNTTEA